MNLGPDHRTIGPKLEDVPGNGREMRLSVGRRAGGLWCALYVAQPSPRGAYDRWLQVDRWASDDPAPTQRLTLELTHEILAEAVLQRRLPGID